MTDIEALGRLLVVRANVIEDLAHKLEPPNELTPMIAMEAIFLRNLGHRLQAGQTLPPSPNDQPHAHIR